RLVVAFAHGQVVLGLVAGAVGAAHLEKQRPQLIAGDGVEQPRRRLAGDLTDTPVGFLRLRLVATPLIRDRRVQTERPDAPAGVETDRVAPFVQRRVAAGSTGQGRRDTGVRAGAVHRAASNVASADGPQIE